jgi:hypothetical protein
MLLKIICFPLCTSPLLVQALQSRSCLSYIDLWLSLSLMLRPTVSRPDCLGIKHPSVAYDQNFITVRQLWVCRCGARSLTRGWVCLLQWLLALASAVILRSESCRGHNHILLSQIQDFPFHCFQRLARLQWRYLTPPPCGIQTSGSESKLCYNWWSVSQSVLEETINLGLKTGSVIWLLSVCTIYILHTIKSMYNIYKASVSPGSVQQIMPYP